MIRYALACDKAHAFESWFPSSAAYDAQAARGLVTCPMCGSDRVGKRLMAPSIARKDKDSERGLDKGVAPEATAPEAPAPEPSRPVALLSERERALRAMLKAVHEHVTAHAEYVGGRFADEARKMHAGEIEHRSIYGEASPAEAKALLEEGIEVHPLPVAPEGRN